MHDEVTAVAHSWHEPLAIGRDICERSNDAPETLFLEWRVPWKRTLIQYRLHPGSTEEGIDYVDREVPMLPRMLEKLLGKCQGSWYYPSPSAETLPWPPRRPQLAVRNEVRRGA